MPLFSKGMSPDLSQLRLAYATKDAKYECICLFASRTLQKRIFILRPSRIL